MLGHAFIAIQAAKGILFNLVKNAVDGLSRSRLYVGSGGAAANLLVETQLKVRQMSVVFFDNVTHTGKHLGAVHVTAISKVPDGSGSHISFLLVRDGTTNSVGHHCNGVCVPEQTAIDLVTPQLTLWKTGARISEELSAQ